MPFAPLRPCSCRPGCSARLPRGQRYCTEGQAKHNRELDGRRGTRQSRGYGASHDAWSRYIRTRDPICCLCRTAPTKVADHIIPKAMGGQQTEDNGQGACHPCHNGKRARERQLYAALTEGAGAAEWLALVTARGLDLRTLLPQGGVQSLQAPAAGPFPPSSARTVKIPKGGTPPRQGSMAAGSRAGRPTESADAKILKGTWRKDREKPASFRPPRGVPRPPAELSKDARAEWERITILLDEAGVVSLVDLAIVAAYCDAYSQWLRACRALKTKGLTFKAPSGYVQQRPEVSIAERARKQAVDFARELGLTPRSRHQVKPQEAKTEEKGSPWDEL